MGNDRLLDKASCPGGLHNLEAGQLPRLCREIRRALIEGVSQTGGHLASNLGVVELTVAIHRVFSSPTDQIVWDVGHQCYTHKLLTGRLKDLRTLRKYGGMGGFPRTFESAHDAFIAGHASTAISAACGLARGKELTGEAGHVIAVVGDGALTGGMAYEGLSNLALNPHGRVVVILNDNKMSISRNVGGLARYLTFLRTNASYYKLKDATKSALGAIPYLGKPMVGAVGSSLALIKNFVYQSDFFENFGYTYMGPIDGHDLGALQEALARAKGLRRPVLLHVETVKGKGYGFAESNPGAYHGVSSFDPKVGGASPPGESYSEVFGRALTKLAEEDSRICAVTAAMKRATGLGQFSARFGREGRFFDVGIAEGHAVTFSAGLAAKGLKPVLAIFSTFLQRGYDQLIHDCAIEPRQIVLGVDRAGLVGEDGETHQGVFDCAYLSGIPGLTVYSPATYRELELSLAESLKEGKGVHAVRYPRGAQPVFEPEYTFDTLKPVHLDCGRALLLVSYGRMFEQVSIAHKKLTESGEKVSLLKLTKVWPLEDEALAIAASHQAVLFVEEGIRSGGIGEHFVARLALGGYKGRLALKAIDDRFVPAGSVAEQMELLGLDARSLVKLALGELASCQ